MKKFFLMAAVALCTVSVATAQTQNTKNKKKTEASDIARIKEEKRTAFEQQRVARLANDSMRRETESMEEMQKDSMRTAWKEQRLAQLDSSNHAQWSQQVSETDQAYATERSLTDIAKAAKLNAYQLQQAKSVTSMYNDKARMLQMDENITEDMKLQQLASLNNERRAKMQAAIGKKNEKKFEKERKKYMLKHTDDMQSAWMNIPALNK